MALLNRQETQLLNDLRSQKKTIIEVEQKVKVSGMADQLTYTHHLEII